MKLKRHEAIQKYKHLRTRIKEISQDLIKLSQAFENPLVEDFDKKTIQHTIKQSNLLQTSLKQMIVTLKTEYNL